ncbi:MAG: ABC transporter permease [Myxococcales bacterium]|nr:ABC transporter permease [Myxococcales bacterium]
MWTLVRRLSLRHLRAAPLRSGLVVLGIALGVAVVVASRATSDSMLHTFDELVERVSGRAELMVVGNESGVPSDLVAEMAAVPGVAHAAAALEITTSFASDRQPLLILGVDFLGDTHFLPFRSENGDGDVVDDPLLFVNDPSALLITRTLAKRRGLSIDSEVTVLSAGGTTTLTVKGIVEDSGPAASFGGQVAVMFLDAAQVAFARGRLVDRIDVAVTQGHDAAAVAAAVERALAGSARVERPEEVGRRLRELSAPLSDGLALSGLVALLVGVFIIYNAIGIAVTQRRRETGVLRALGVVRRQVVLHFCLEALVLSLLGIGVGLVLSQQLVQATHAQTSEAISRMYAANPSSPRIGLEHVLWGAGAGLLISFGAAFLPARRGARLAPVSALRGDIESRGGGVPYRALAVAGLLLMGVSWLLAPMGSELTAYLATFGDLAGAAMLAPLLVVVLRRALSGAARGLFGVAGRLGLEYVERDLGRSTVNVLALMVAVSLSVAVSGWLTSFERSIRDWFEQVTAADMAITAGSPIADRTQMPLSPDALEKLQGLEGVEALQPMRMIEQRHGERAFRLVASDTQVYLEQAARRHKPWRVLDGRDPIESDALSEAPRIVLGENAAHQLGLAAGDTMELQTPSGKVAFEVRAVVVDYSSEIGAGFIDRRYYLESWKDPALDVINVYLKPGATSETVAQKIHQRLGGGDALFVTETTEIREQYLGLVEESFSYTRSLELIVLVIALLGVVGTMVAAVIDRTRQLGILRAVGASRRQVVASMVVESAFLGFCAALIGIAAGAVQCLMFLEILVAKQSGWHLSFIFPYEGAVRIGLLVVLTAAVAGFVPGLRAARLDVKEALAYE